jgi:NADH dehydrogenase [ubiquinone] 1 alpha subcomplex assembly factor 7
LIAKNNGACLFVDYGEDSYFSDSIRGIRKHKFVENQQILEFPGEIDLSAYVNFRNLAAAA